MSEIQLRRATAADADACGRIIYDAFCGIAQKHNFPPDFPSIESAVAMARAVTNNPGAFGVVAERGGKIVGSNFLDQRDAIAGVGPITVDPAHQGGGVGRKLMQAVLERGREAPGIRLVQEPFNTVSLPLYASLGFKVKEPLALMRGKPTGHATGQAEGRLMQEGDLSSCAQLCKGVHGFERTNELRDSLKMLRPFVLLRNGRVAANASAPTFWILNHGVAQTEQDMIDLLLAAGAANAEPVSLLVPIRRASFFRWCIAAGPRVVKPMTLMTIGKYQDPQGAFFPSVVY
jgi:predicted N-acetyltransferase YhbS